jgi:hypothetical protein
MVTVTLAETVVVLVVLGVDARVLVLLFLLPKFSPEKTKSIINQMTIRVALYLKVFSQVIVKTFPKSHPLIMRKLCLTRLFLFVFLPRLAR